MSPQPSRPALFLFSAVLLALLSLLCFAYPLYVIWPFRHQGATQLSLALFVKQIGPWVSVVLAVTCGVLVVFAWKRTRRWLLRSAAVLSIILAILGVFLSRANVYEQMFHPLGVPQFASADTARVDPNDMVLAIRVRDVSRAYPIREIAYHHIVNDTLAGEPVVATY
jgi:hypothetical protein